MTDENTILKIGDNLKILRIRNDLTQEQSADMMCVTKQTISKWEKGKCLPQLDRLLDILNTYHCTCEDILNGCTGIDYTDARYKRTFMVEIKNYMRAKEDRRIRMLSYCNASYKKPMPKSNINTPEADFAVEYNSKSTRG